MVVKRSRLAEAKERSEDVNATSEDDDVTDPETGSSEVVGKDEKEVEPAPKKLKRDLTKEAEAELNDYDLIVKNSDIKFTDKLTKLSLYLRSVFENNVNTLEFAINFNDWIKKSLTVLLDEGTVASVEFYEFLCNVLKVAPTIIEPICEKVLSFVFTRHHFSQESNLAFENFMENLSYTFEKLRRFPKLIAKLLCCVRDNVNGMNELVGSTGAKKFIKKMLGYKSKDNAMFILPKRFMDSYTSVVSMLSAGQMIDLWKTLHHNLEEECIKKYNPATSTSVTCFLSVVVDLVVTFLCSIKVADYSVPTSTVERVVEMMDKLKQNCVSELSSLRPSEYDTAFIRSYLKLCNAWSHLHHFMTVYNENYAKALENNVKDFQEAVDLSFFFPHLSSEGWLSLWTEINKNKDDTSASLMVSLVALKLKYFAVIQQKRGNKDVKQATDTTIKSEDVEQDALQKSMQEAAKFLWNHQQSLRMEDDSTVIITEYQDTLRIATSYLQQDELMEHANTLLDSQLVSKQPSSNQTSIQSFHQQLSSNMNFRVAVVLEALYECVKRIGKGNALKETVKKFLAKCLNPACKMKILKGLELNSKITALDEELKKSMTEAVQIVNDVIKLETNQSDPGEQISVPLLGEIFSVVGYEELAQYPNAVKTVIFLSSMLIFTAIMKYCKSSKEYEIVDELSSVLSECGRNSQGNEFLFHIKWAEFFGVLKSNSNHLYEKSTKSLCSLVMESIYVSPKIANEFGDCYIKSICKDDIVDILSTEGYLTVCVLDHILGDLIGTKTKSASVLTTHARELCGVVINKLSDGSIITELHSLIHSMKKNKRKSLSTPTKKSQLPNYYVSRVMFSCYLLLKGKSFISPEDASEIAVILLPYMNFALDYLELHSKKSIEDDAIPALLYCIQFLFEALKAFQDYRDKLPDDFLLRSWKSLCTLESCKNDEIKKKTNTELPKLILEISDESEFQSICDSVIEGMDCGKESAIAAHVLSSLITAETSNEKKKHIRRSTIELSLYKYLDNINSWKDSGDFTQAALPYIQFQIMLLKRRKPMGSMSTLSICMTSVTAIPLDKIESIDSFKSTFSTICDLLNALLVHRLDVISFRSHVFVQCFQFLIESLVTRADQKNKLADNEIYYLRQSAHCIERLCQSAKLGRQELARVSPYLIVILLRQFEKTTVYPIVKNPLLNGCYKLLDMCDDHGVSHVNSMLSTGSREIFKAVYELYKKFYRYKGKV